MSASSSPNAVTEVEVAEGISVLDATQNQLLGEILRAYDESQRGGRQHIVTAVHVGGLVARREPGYLEALAASEVVYADSAAVVLIAKLRGAMNIERSPTTDIGIPVLVALAEHIGRPLRIALVGGKGDRAASAAEHLATVVSVEITYTGHGFRTSAEWGELWEEFVESRPDVVILGLGAPRETIQAVALRRHDIPGLVLTCGGWFGFLAGEEKRAPQVAQSAGLEWVFRLLQ